MAKINLSLEDKQIYIILLALLVIVVVAGAIIQSYAGTVTFTQEQSLQIAREAVLDSPTYAFDGFELVEKGTMGATCPQCWIFTLEFKSGHAGYGNRADRMLAQVITPHKAVVVVESGSVRSAILDEKWDIRGQEYIDGSDVPPEAPYPPEPQEPQIPQLVGEEESLEAARQFVLDSPTYKFDGSGLSHNRTGSGAACMDCWTFYFDFQSSHSGYGDRSGQVLAQVMTPHTAAVELNNGNVSSAVLDGKWDMISQEFIEGQEPAGAGPSLPAAGFCGWSTNASCNSDAGCKTSGCSSQVCISLSQLSVTTTCEWQECYDASAYDLDCKCVDRICQWSG